MVAYFHQRAGAERLIWVFVGWGMDQRLFLDRPLPGLSCQEQTNASVLILFDYGAGPIQWIEQDPDLESRTVQLSDWEELLAREEIITYSKHVLWAWSMGVWAAEQFVLPELEIAVAVNGTARPVDDRFGIPVDIFQGTLQGLSSRNLEKFRRRMCGNTARLADFKTREPQRELANLMAELSYIGDASQAPNPFPKQWNRALLSQEDAIFPIQNMQHYWISRNVPCILCSGAHYPFES